MPTELKINTVFKGTVAGEIIRAIFMEADTLKKGLISEILNVKGSYAFLRTVLLENGLIDYQCKFEPAGDVEFDEKEVRLKKIMLPIELCKEDFRDTWEGQQMSSSAHNSEGIPEAPLEAIMLTAKEMVASVIENDIWIGDYGKSGRFGGLLVELIKNANDKAISFLPSDDEITVANVEDILGGVIDATPIEVLQRSDFKLVIDVKTMSKYKRSLRLANFAMSEAEFDGYKLETANGLPKGTIIAYTKGNLKFLAGTKEDFNEIQIIDLSDKTGDDVVRLKMVYNAGATYVKADYIRVYMEKASQDEISAFTAAPNRWISDATNGGGEEEEGGE